MARNLAIKILRTTRNNLDTQATAENLNQGELYHVTDENVLSLGTAVGAYTDMAKPPLQVGSLTLTAASWTTGVSFKEYELSNVNITADDIVEVIPDNADIDIVAAAEILPATVSAAGKVTIYAVNTPTDDIGVTINITRKA